NLGASHLPDVIEKQMQQKMGAQQNAQQADYELQRQQTLAKAKVAEAEGDAQAILVKAKAQAEANKLLQEALTPLLIQNKAIERSHRATSSGRPPPGAAPSGCRSAPGRWWSSCSPRRPPPGSVGSGAAARSAPWP